MRPFGEDMRALAESREMRATVEATAAQTGQEWIAADMTIDASETFVTGLIGFTTSYSGETDHYAIAFGGHALDTRSLQVITRQLETYRAEGFDEIVAMLDDAGLRL